MSLVISTINKADKLCHG